MSKYRARLPQLEGGVFLTDGGLESTLLFLEGWEMPCFAAYPLLDRAEAAQAMRDYFVRYIEVARRHRVGFVLEAPTWRANPDWGAQLGHDAAHLDAFNRRAVDFLRELRDAYEVDGSPMVISGNIGPRGDGYIPGALMEPDEAEAYHTPQMRTHAASGVDMASAFTINNIPEAIGVARAGAKADLPTVISFTVETDGKLPTGHSLEEAIGQVDEATAAGPVYYMINCAHPTHFADALSRGGAWVKRIRGLRGNASKLSHAELETCTELDSGDPEAFGRENAELVARHPHLCVLGGCCGTDHRHVQAIGRRCLAVEQAA